jgi:hypothetical protein
MAWLILPGLEADATLGYTRARYDEYTDPNSAASYDGNRMLMSPEYTARVGLQYRAESGLFVRGDMNYVSDFYWNGANTYKRSPVTTFDARVGWESESFDVYLFGRNFFGARYLDYSPPPTSFRRGGDGDIRPRARLPVLAEAGARTKESRAHARDGMSGGGFRRAGVRKASISLALRYGSAAHAVSAVSVHGPSAGGRGDGGPPDGCGLASGGGGRSRGAIPAEQTVVQGSR